MTHPATNGPHSYNEIRKLTTAIGRWVAAIVAVLLVGVLTWGARTILAQDDELDSLRAEIAAVRAEMKPLGEKANKSEQWIVDWYDVLKVPERDQRQDDAIEELRRRLGERRP